MQDRTSAEQHVAAFVNMLYSSRIYFINTTVIYKFTALLKFIYNTCDDLLKHVSCAVLFNGKKLLHKNCYLIGQNLLRNLIGDLIEA